MVLLDFDMMEAINGSFYTKTKQWVVTKYYMFVRSENGAKTKLEIHTNKKITLRRETKTFTALLPELEIP